MSKSYRRRQDRVSRHAIDETIRYADAIGFRAAGLSWGEIAAELGYRSRSGAENAVRRGLEGSWLIVGLRVVMYKRVDRLKARLRVLESAIAPDMVGLHGATLDHLEHMRLRLHDVPGAGPWRACVADVAGMVARRNPHLPFVDKHQRDGRFRSRQSGATLESMRGGYANRSAVLKALERDVRRLLLEAAAEYFAGPLEAIRCLWRDIDLALRRRPVDVLWLWATLEVLDELLESMHVFDVLLTYGHLARPRPRPPRRTVLTPCVSSPRPDWRGLLQKPSSDDAPSWAVRWPTDSETWRPVPASWHDASPP